MPATPDWLRQRTPIQLSGSIVFYPHFLPLTITGIVCRGRPEVVQRGFVRELPTLRPGQVQFPIQTRMDHLGPGLRKCIQMPSGHFCFPGCQPAITTCTFTTPAPQTQPRPRLTVAGLSLASVLQAPAIGMPTWMPCPFQPPLLMMSASMHRCRLGLYQMRRTAVFRLTWIPPMCLIRPPMFISLVCKLSVIPMRCSLRPSCKPNRGTNRPT